MICSESRCKEWKNIFRFEEQFQTTFQEAGAKVPQRKPPWTMLIHVLPGYTKGFKNIYSNDRSNDVTF